MNGGLFDFYVSLGLFSLEVDNDKSLPPYIVKPNIINITKY